MHLYITAIDIYSFILKILHNLRTEWDGSVTINQII